MAGLALLVGLPTVGAGAVARDLDTGAEWQGEQVISWASMDVTASTADAFAVLSDYDRLAEFMPGLLRSRVVSRDGSTVIVEQSAEERILFLRQRIDVRLRIVETPPRRLTIQSVSGSFKSFDGSYELSPVREARAAEGPAGEIIAPQTRIEYRARFVPDFELSNLMGPYVVKRSLERHMNALAGEIGRRAGGVPVRSPHEEAKENR